MTPRPPRRQALATCVLGLAAALILVGCSSTVTGRPTDTDGTPMTTSAPDQPPASTTPLADRPTSATVSATYDQMQTDIRAAVSAVAPTVVWKLRREPSAAGCSGELSNRGGRTAFLQPWGADATIPDDQWPAVVAAVNSTIASYQFGALTPIVDRPSDHLAEAVGPYGATIEIGSANNTILSVITGCHPE